LEQNTIYDGINFTQRAWGQNVGGLPLVGLRVPFLRCPSDALYDAVYDSSNLTRAGFNANLTVAGYGGSEGFHWWQSADLNPAWGGNEGGGIRTVQCDGSAMTNGAWFRGSPHAYSPTYITAWGINTEWPGTSSYHTGGMNATMGDGSVQFIAQSIDMRAYIALNGIGDGANALFE
jgi:prepilin-type processing-associated H-X9-DG protein